MNDTIREVDTEHMEQGECTRNKDLVGCTKTQKATDTTHYCQQQMRVEKNTGMTNMFPVGLTIAAAPPPPAVYKQKNNLVRSLVDRGVTGRPRLQQYHHPLRREGRRGDRDGGYDSQQLGAGGDAEESDGVPIRVQH